MFKQIEDFFGKRMAVEGSKREEELTERLPLATCALLLEMAHADEEFSDVEKHAIVSLVKEQFNLSDQLVEELIEVAERERRESIDLWGFAHLIDSRYSEEQKVRVVEILWKVVFADGKVDMHEEYLVRKLAYLLGLEHEHLIEAKLRAGRGT